MVVLYSPRYHINIGTHVFPTIKYSRVFSRLQREAPAGLRFVEPEPASWEDIALVHTPQYIDKLKTGDFTIEELALLEIPWSPDVVEGFRVMTGGTIGGARLAVARSDGPIVTHVGGGLHHAFPSHGEGFCVFNDVAVALRVLFRDALVARAAVIDLDVHHGNGTAFIFAGDQRVFTFSMHQQYNYPLHKPRSTLDIALADATGDDEYLDKLQGALVSVFEHEPEIVLYLAGADPYEDDQLGGLALTKEGLRARDRTVLEACRARNVPAVVLLAGGYARKIDDTVDIHFETAAAAAAVTRASGQQQS
jgi:acetoin utilization deacetylase AcuC-like enzyme